MLELNVLLDDRMSIELLKRTPSSYLGSCRFKPVSYTHLDVYKRQPKAVRQTLCVPHEP